MTVQRVEVNKMKWHGFTLKKGFLIIADEEGIGLSSGWGCGDELFVYRRSPEGRWIGNWEYIPEIFEENEIEGEEFVIEWKLYDEEERRYVCGGGGFATVYASDYDSARRKAVAECVRDLRNEGKEIVDIDWSYCRIEYTGGYSLCDFG